MSESIDSRLERLERLLSPSICIGGKTELQRRLEDRQLAEIYRLHGIAAYRVERRRLNDERREALNG
jgi:hypothetical protein